MFFVTTSKILMRLNVAFLESLQRENVLIVFIFHETFVPVNKEHSFRPYNSLIFTRYERATVGNSLHVRSKFMCLIMTSNELMQYVYVTSHYVL